VCLDLFTRPFDLVEHLLHYIAAVVGHDDRYGFHQTSPVLALTLSALPIPRRPVVVYGLLRMAYRLQRLTPLTRRPRRLPTHLP
jgi:hypothetical protein